MTSCGPRLQLTQDLRRLSDLPAGVSVATVDCDREASLCASQRIHKFPSVSLYKVDGFQSYHGKMRGRDIALWTEVSASRFHF